MKKNISVLLFLVLSFSLSAEVSLQVEQKKADDFYKKGKYEEAITAYESMLPKDKESPQIFYNLGNAYYKSGQTAKAILYYERALLIKPNFDDARFNLEMAQTKVVDKINKVDSFFLKKGIDIFANTMISNSWAVMSVVLFILCLALCFVYAFSHIVVLRKISFYAAIVLLIISLSGMTMAKMQKDKVEKREYAIIMASSVTVKGSPDEGGTSLFLLHEGTKVKIKNSVDTWVEVQVADGNVGWILSSDLEKI